MHARLDNRLAVKLRVQTIKNIVIAGGGDRPVESVGQANQSLVPGTDLQPLGEITPGLQRASLVNLHLCQIGVAVGYSFQSTDGGRIVRVPLQHRVEIESGAVFGWITESIRRQAILCLLQ